MSVALGGSARKIVFRGQWSACWALPIWAVAMTVAAGGGLLMAGFVLIAVPFGLVLAVPPFLARRFGTVRRPEDLPVIYSVATVALWIAVAGTAYSVAFGQPAPAELAVDTSVPDAVGLVAAPAVPLLWIAQAITGIVGVRANRSASATP